MPPRLLQRGPYLIPQSNNRGVQFRCLGRHPSEYTQVPCIRQTLELLAGDHSAAACRVPSDLANSLGTRLGKSGTQ